MARELFEVKARVEEPMYEDLRRIAYEKRTSIAQLLIEGASWAISRHARGAVLVEGSQLRDVQGAA